MPLKFFEKGGYEFGPAAVCSERIPEVAVGVSTVSVFARIVERGRKFGEKLLTLIVTFDLEGDRCDPIFSVSGQAIFPAGIDLKAGAVVAVTDRPVVDEFREKATGPGDCGIDFGVLNAALFGEKKREVAGESGLIECAVTREPAVEVSIVDCFPGKSVSPGATMTLAHGSFHSVFANGRQDVIVSGKKVVFREQEVLIAA